MTVSLVIGGAGFHQGFGQDLPGNGDGFVGQAFTQRGQRGCCTHPIQPHIEFMARAGQRQARPIASTQSLDHHPRPERRRDGSAIHIIGRVVWVGRKLT